MTPRAGSPSARRLALAAVAGAALTVVGAGPALADDPLNRVTCASAQQPGCDVNAGTRGSPDNAAASPKPGGATSRTASSGATRCRDTTGAVAPCSDPNLGWLGADGCYYKTANPSQELQDALGGKGAQPGGWYEYTCPGTQGTGGGIRWMDDPSPVPVAASPEVLARQATSRLQLPPLALSVSPSGTQLVHLPTWLWIDPQQWRARSASASVPGVVVTATATPTRVVWSPGDGATVACAGPGTPWRAGADPSAASPTCGHVYTRSSASAPGGVFRVTATVSWSITWTGAGQSGTLPALTTTATDSVRVNEVQAVVVSG